MNLVKSFVASGILGSLLHGAARHGTAQDARMMWKDVDVLLGIPYAFSQAGVLVAIPCILVLAFISNYCIRLLLITASHVEAHTHKRATFHAIGKFAFGNAGVVRARYTPWRWTDDGEGGWRGRMATEDGEGGWRGRRRMVREEERPNPVAGTRQGSAYIYPVGVLLRLRHILRRQPGRVRPLSCHSISSHPRHFSSPHLLGIG